MLHDIHMQIHVIIYVHGLNLTSRHSCAVLGCWCYPGSTAVREKEGVNVIH